MAERVDDFQGTRGRVGCHRKLVVERSRMSLAEKNGAELHGYDVGERAFLLTASASGGAYLNIAASAQSPVVNPMFLINNWGTENPKLSIDGREIEKGEDFGFGHYESLELEGERKWENVLAVWAKVHATEPMQVSISTGAISHPYRTGHRSRAPRSKLA